MLARRARLHSFYARTSERPLFLAERLEDRRLLSAVAPVLHSATQTLNASTPDSDNQTPTTWFWYVNEDVNTLSSQLANNYRIVSLSIAQASPLLLNAALVQNTGSYAQTWWWYVGQTTTQISSELTANNARIVDVNPYIDSGGQEKFAVVMTSNTADNAKAWWWYVNQSTSQISSELTANNARLVDLDHIDVNGTPEYSAVMISNTGADQKAWWWYVNQTTSQISNLLNTNNARLVHIDPVDATHFNVIMDASAGEEWWWYVGESTSQLSSQLAQNGARIFDVESYLVGGQTVYAALMINNSNPVETNVGNILRNASPTASTGLYLKQLDGPVLAQLQPDKQFEPASMIKALLNLTAMRAVQAGTASLNEQLYMYYSPGNPYIDFNNPGNPNENPDSYADTASNRVLLPMSVLLSRMMEISDNRATKAIEQRFGIPAINATAQLAGMSNTVFASTLGSGIPGNFLTLDDAGKLYEGVLNRALLDEPDAAQFFDNMSDQPDPGEVEPVPIQDSIFGPFQTDVTQEAANILGLATSDPLVTQLATAFVAGMKGAWKGGGYTIPTPVSPSEWDEIRTVGGYLGLPVEDSSGNTTLHDYVYGIFIDGALVPQNPYPNPQVDAVNNAWSNSQQELLRGVIHDALASWYVNPNLIVTNLNDSGAGSLRQAIQIADQSVGTATIRFAQGLSGTITLTHGELSLNNSYAQINIVGPGAAVIAIAGDHSRVFDIAQGTSAAISKVTIENGSTAGGLAIADGGGILVLGSLNLQSSNITQNSAGAGAGGGIAVGSTGHLTLADCSLSGNTAAQGAGISDGGTLTASDSTVANNTSSGQGGGIYFAATGAQSLTNLTISGNRAGQGGGIFRSTGTVTVDNTIVAGNFRNATTTSDDINGAVATASAFNLIGTGGAGGLVNGTNSNQVGVGNPGLSALGNYGGQTPTMALMFNSPAYNKGSNALLVSGDTTDQRGLPRIFGASVDIGAYESQPPTQAGDVDHNGVVNFADLLALAQHYGQTAVPMYELGDLTGDGQVTFADLLLLAQNYGHGSMGAAAVKAAIARAAKARRAG